MLHAKGRQRIVAGRRRGQPQQIIGKAIASVLSVECEAAARGKGGMVSIYASVVVLNTEVNKMLSTDQVHTARAIPAVRPQMAIHTPQVTEAGVAADRCIRQSHSGLPARRREALDTGFIGVVGLADLGADKGVVRFLIAQVDGEKRIRSNRIDIV